VTVVLLCVLGNLIKRGHERVGLMHLTLVGQIRFAPAPPHLVEAEVLARDSLRVCEGSAVEQQALVHARDPGAYTRPLFGST
jgi:hypothetical protein